MYSLKSGRCLILALAFMFLIMGVSGCGFIGDFFIGEDAEETIDEVTDEVLDEEEEEREEKVDEKEELNGEEEVVEEEEEKDEEVNPYEEAEEVVPMEDRVEAMDEDFRSVLNEIFEKEPKLVSIEDMQPLEYVVDRVITPDDVSEIKDLLDENGYETVGTRIEGNEYELDLSISEEVVEERYDGDVGGNMYVVFWTAEEGEEAQKIYVRTL